VYAAHFATRQLNGASSTGSSLGIAAAGRHELSSAAAAAQDAVLQAAVRLASCARRKELNNALQPSLRRGLRAAVVDAYCGLLGPPTPTESDGCGSSAIDVPLDVGMVDERGLAAMSVLSQHATALFEGFCEAFGETDAALLSEALQVGFSS
jgi:hypothetical protein